MKAVTLVPAPATSIGRLASPRATQKPYANGADEFAMMQLIAAGDEHALNRLYEQFAVPLRAIAETIVGPGADANDVLQESMTAIWLSAGRYQPALGSVFVWASAIVRDRAMECKRRRLRDRIYFTDSTALQIRPDDDAAFARHRHDGAQLIDSAITALNPDEYRALKCVYLQGLTHVEIAAKLNVPVGTIKARIRRGMLRLRRATLYGYVRPISRPARSA